MNGVNDDSAARSHSSKFHRSNNKVIVENSYNSLI